MVRLHPLDPYSAQLGPYVRQLRRAAGLSQEQLAERADVAADTIGKLERSQFSPSVETLRKVAHGLGCSPGRLLALFEADPTSSGEHEVLATYRRSDRRTREAIRAAVSGLGMLSGPLPFD
jgi:transcriptional regulator with XRE-family HTH domain